MAMTTEPTPQPPTPPQAASDKPGKGLSCAPCAAVSRPRSRLLNWVLVGITILILWVFYGPSPDPTPWRSDAKVAFAQAKELKKPVLAYFTAQWCGACKALQYAALPSSEVQRLIDERYIPLKVDLTGGEPNELAERYKITSYPTLLLISPEGAVVDSVVGAMSAGDLALFLRQK